MRITEASQALRTTPRMLRYREALGLTVPQSFLARARERSHDGKVRETADGIDPVEHARTEPKGQRDQVADVFLDQ